MKFGVVIFPGSNCDHDMVHALETVMGYEVLELWHKDTHLHGLTTDDCIVLPGGFSYGDYLRCGAIARFSPIMKNVIQFARDGGFVLGICNGFQVLCEAHLLPGVLLLNQYQKFICKKTPLKVVSRDTPFTAHLDPQKAYEIPIAHAEGRFYADNHTIQQLWANNQILFQYATNALEITPQANPNGSIDNIAGICNAQKNVFGMMPHPERAVEEILGSEDGLILLKSLAKSLEERMATY